MILPFVIPNAVRNLLFPLREISKSRSLPRIKSGVGMTPAGFLR